MEVDERTSFFKRESVRDAARRYLLAQRGFDVMCVCVCVIDHLKLLAVVNIYVSRSHGTAHIYE